MVPYGKVASYGQIAAMVGLPRAARQVGWILNGLEDEILENKKDFPWWRIINNAGRISIKGTKFNDAKIQRQKLEAEGIIVTKLFELDIKKYRYLPTPSDLEKLELDDVYIEFLLEKYQI